MKIRITCKKCGSEAVERDASVFWHEESQSWLVSNFYTHKPICHDCGDETELEEFQLIETEKTAGYNPMNRSGNL